MRMIGGIRSIFSKASRKVARWRSLADLVCGDCDRWERCYATGDSCIVLAQPQQVARDDWSVRRRAGALRQSRSVNLLW